MRNFLITITYDGSCFHGWQIQKNALTVQEVFQDALFKVISEKPDIKACSQWCSSKYVLPKYENRT